MRCQTSGVSITAGASERRPTRALTAIACWMVKVTASIPISNVPRGVDAPMQTLRRPIILPRMAGGVASMVMVLCIVLKPAWPHPPRASRAKARTYQGGPGEQHDHEQHNHRSPHKDPSVVLETSRTGYHPGPDELPETLRRGDKPTNPAPTPRYSLPMAGMNCRVGKASAFITIVTYNSPRSMGLCRT